MCGAVSDIEACIPALRRHATALLRERRDVDALVHACLSRALDQHWRQNPTELRTWLFAIMYRQLGQLPWSARTRRASHTGDQGLPGTLGQLTADQRSVLLLVTIEDMAYGDVADVLGVSVSSVMTLLGDGRERLRRLCGDLADTAAPRQP